MLNRTLLTVLFAASAFGQTAPPHPLTAELQKVRMPVVLKDGRLTGAGAELLHKELANTQFFLIGEEHGTADIARFSTALLPEAWKNGYRHATHTMRGRSMTGVYDIGSMLPELATANGMRSFQIMVIPRSGFTNAHRPFSPNADDKRAPYDPAKELPFDAKPLFDAASATDWSLFDLRALRAPLARRKLEPIEDRFRNVLWGYDAILVIPDVSPATLFH